MSQTSAHLPDAQPTNWVDRFAPASLRPWLKIGRFDRPVGIWLLMLPGWQGIALADAMEHRAPNLGLMGLVALGAALMRAAGCAYNDIVDRDIDQAVARTRSRPIPSGQVSVAQAKLFMLAQASVGLVVLISFNWFSVALGCASLLIVAVYPFMKRITDWPQFVLGLAFSWGALMGWAASFGRLDWPAVLLYAGAILWTIGYDTIYAHQDKEDDVLVGVRSTARLFGSRTKPALIVLYAGALVLIGWACGMAGAGVAAFVGLAAAAVHMGWQIVRLDIDDGDRCLELFRSNRETGWLIFAGLVADAAIGALLR